jgi:hypothetical protein
MELPRPLTTVYSARPGPFQIEQLRYPDLLSGIIKEIDATE